MTKEDILKYFEDINFVYNNCSMYDSLSNMLDELEQEPKFIAKADGTIEQIKDCEDCLFKKEWEKIGKLISVVLEKRTEQEINSDYISREKTLEKFCDYVGAGMSMNDFDALYDIVSKMPSVQPKTGRWIMHDNHRECSECGVYLLKDMPRNSYCPNCGAKMSEIPTGSESEG